MNQELWTRYLRGAADRWIDGVRLQARRCSNATNEATSFDSNFFDSNFLVVAVTRLREVACVVRDRIREDRIRDAIALFDDEHPELRDVRDYQEHILHPELIGSAMYFARGELSRLRADGGVDVLVDPDSIVESAERLYRAINNVLPEVSGPATAWVIRPAKKRRAWRAKRTHTS
jgi:hypothetical protein